jgi:hypothetical protein
VRAFQPKFLSTGPSSDILLVHYLMVAITVIPWMQPGDVEA